MEEKENRVKLARIIVSALLLAAAAVLDRFVLPASFPGWATLLLYLPAYFVIGYDVIIEAGTGIIHGDVFGEEFLMVIATVGAFAVGFLPGGEPEYAEAVFVMLFFGVGELFEDIAEDRSRKSITGLMDLRPDVVNVERGGETVAVAPESVNVGDTVVLRPGDRAALDGSVIEGVSSLDTSALTGESLPRDVEPGDNIVSGSVNLSGLIKVKVTKPFSESTASKILELVENASEHKSKSEKFISKFSKIYTPAVVSAALVLAFLPPVISGDFAGNIAVWLRRALTFLVISCPCALVVSVPLAFFGGVGGASRAGILVKGSDHLETLSKLDTAVFDKTGTLTRGTFEVTIVHPSGVDEETLLHRAAHVERYSTHPIALSLRRAYEHESDSCDVSDVREVPGEGVFARVNGKTVAVGNEKFMDDIGAGTDGCRHNGTVVHVATDGVYTGHIVISDKIKDDAKSAVRELGSLGIRTYMLTGDREETAKEISAELGLDGYRAELLPAGKVKCLEELATGTKGTLAFVGDGINDAPVLAGADVGIAMGALGSDAAIEAADVVLMDDKPSGVAKAVRIAKKTVGIAKENIIFALAVKFAVLVTAAFGIAPMWLAVFADVGVTVIAVLNSVRTLKIKENKNV